MNPYQVVRDFERALCDYTGAPYAVTTTSCTMALLLAVAWHLRNNTPTVDRNQNVDGDSVDTLWRQPIEIPKRTYVGVPMSIIHAGGRPTFRDEDWRGMYQLRPLPVFDCARYFTGGLYNGATVLEHQGGPVRGVLRAAPGTMLCVSFHWSKTLGIQQGGAILHDNPEADAWLRRARFDGREEGVAPKDQKTWQLGYHAYMAPETAAAGLVRLANLPRNNEPMPWDDYPDLSKLEIFK
jgi:dTDP-4-amino-4,6-dideoxygalactose transaminase